MGLLSYVTSKLVKPIIGSAEPNISETTSGFSTFKFVVITGSISLVLFGVGYMFMGMGNTLKPVSEIVDELHDSNDSNDSNDSEDSESSENLNNDTDSEKSA